VTGILAIGLAFEFEAENALLVVKLSKAKVVLMASTYGSKYLGDEKTSVSTRCY
jgi:hypothetical protein